MKLLFVEDEEETRNGILNYVNWERLGIDCVISFSNPLEALAYAEEEQVDIVLSDIRMPHMDGIQLCRRILEKTSSAAIIFISGYSDKEYLLSAIQMSVVDYVEKPINVGKLEETIEKAVERRMQIKQLQRNQETALEIVHRNEQFGIDQLIAKLIHGQPLEDTSLPEQMPINETDYYRVYLWKSRVGTVGFRENVFEIGKALSEAKIVPHFLCSQKSEQICLLVARFPDSLLCDTQKIDRLLHRCLREEGMEHFISCSYGSLVQGVSNIRDSYQQAVLAMQENFYTGYGAVLPYKESRSGISSDCPVAPLSMLTEGIRTREPEICRQCLVDFYRTSQSRTDVLPDMIKNEYFKMISLFTDSDPQQVTWGADTAGIKYLWKHINPLDTLEECQNYALEEVKLYFDHLKGIISDKKIVLDVMCYVQGHYREHNLYINQIAEQIHMSPNYLSALFKKETGRTIGNYITEVRMEQSCELLKQTKKKLSDVAWEVGYTDANYYSKLFRKYYNQLPSEYRNRFI